MLNGLSFIIEKLCCKLNMLGKFYSYFISFNLNEQKCCLILHARDEKNELNCVQRLDIKILNHTQALNMKGKFHDVTIFDLMGNSGIASLYFQQYFDNLI